MAEVPGTQGHLNFMSSNAESSLFRNGRVFVTRETDGNDQGSAGVEIESRTVPVTNGRGCNTTCEINGFELLEAPLEDTALDFLDNQKLLDRYYPTCEDIVRASTGTPHVFAFDHNIRSAAGKKNNEQIRNGQNVQQPIHLVHGDYTLRSAPERLNQLTQTPAGNDTYVAKLAAGQSLVPPGLAKSASRFAIINVWRNILELPVTTHPLALCDGQTVAPEDLVVFEIRYANRIGENYFSKPAPQHKFFYFPLMTRDEVLLIKQWDSAGNLATTSGREADAANAPCTFSFHSAFEPTPGPNTEIESEIGTGTDRDRRSIEVRCLALYE